MKWIYNNIDIKCICMIYNIVMIYMDIYETDKIFMINKGWI